VIQRTILHLGGAKTASTTLQTAVFLRALNIHHFGEGGDGITTAQEEFRLNHLLHDDESLFDYREVEDLFQRHRKLAEDRTFVFSSADVLLANRPTVLANRFYQLLGSETYVLLVVRNQVNALSSLYSGHGAWLKPAPEPHFRRFVRFDDWLRFQWLRPPSSALASFAYWEQLQPFIAKFGRERIKLVTFERLITGDESTWAILSELFGLGPKCAWDLFSTDRQRERISVNQVRYGRALGAMHPFVSAPDVRLVAGPIRKHLARGSRFVPEWKIDMLDQVQDFYRNGNTALEREFSLGLSDLSYPMDLIK
jgi:hypothetical protein